MKRILSAAALVLLAITRASAQQPAAQDSLLQRMAGHWLLQGTIARQQTTHDVDFEWVLSGNYLRMHEVSREKDAKGSPQYEAIVYLGKGKTAEDYSVLWLDNTGAGGLLSDAIGHGTRKGDSIPFLFTYQGVFHTTFVYNRQNDTWQWLMDNDDHGQLKPFARVTLTRKP